MRYLATIAVLVALAMGCAAQLLRSMCFRNGCSAPVRVNNVGGATQYTCAQGCPAGTHSRD